MNEGQRFRKAYIEISSACNLACSFCPPTQRPAAVMPPERFGQVLDQLKGRADHLYLHVKGEPLLHPELGQLLELAAGAGFKAHLVTNGTLLGPNETLLLGNPALHQVSVSLHAYHPGLGTPEQYLGPILNFAREAAPKGPIVALRFWTTPHPALLAAVEREFGWSAPSESDRTGRGYRVGASTYVHFEQEFQWPSLDGEFRGTEGFCLGLRDQVAVLVDGTVVPCCLDGEGAIALGNLFQDTLESILQGERARLLYRGFTERRCVESLCQHCGFRSELGRKRLDHSSDRAEV